MTTRGAAHQLAAVDRAVYDAIAITPTPDLDGPLRRLSRAADKSRIWLALAAVLALAGGPAGRRAAIRGTLAIGATSALVNLAIKPIGHRARPDRTGAGVPGGRQVRMPDSTSFPSGHSASAFAFATAISRDRPWVALGAGFLAAAVAYSRVHTGVHYPGDTVIGSLIGASTGLAVAGLLDRHLSPAPACPPEGVSRPGAAVPRRECPHPPEAERSALMASCRVDTPSLR